MTDLITTISNAIALITDATHPNQPFNTVSQVMFDLQRHHAILKSEQSKDEDTGPVLSPVPTEDGAPS